MYIEDLIITLAWSLSSHLNQWDKKFILSVADAVTRKTGLTEKQSVLAVKILKRHSANLETFLSKDVSNLIHNPQYRLPIRKVNNSKKITIVDNQEMGKLIKIEFPFNSYVNLLRANREKLFYCQWDGEEKAWFVALSEPAIKFIVEYFDLNEFECDDLFKKYLNDSIAIKNEFSKYVPILISTNSGVEIKNCSPRIPKCKFSEFLPAIFDARKKGITTWDDILNQFVDSDEVLEATRNFLKTDPGEDFNIDSENNDISCLEDIILHLTPCMFIIPGGKELVCLEQIHDFLKILNIESTDISVLFRLPSSTDTKFNLYVKNQQLNSPLSENTKYVFVSHKMPKPIFKTNFKFHSVINLGLGGVHYSMRDYLINHENVVNYRAKTIKSEDDIPWQLVKW